MSEELLSFGEVLEQTKSEKQRVLLLGNGFSMAYNHERFSFTSLLESAVENGLIEENSPMYKVFQEFETKDFEEVIKLLESSSKVIDYYSAGNPTLKSELINDSHALKEHLVSIITNNHPEKATVISSEEYISCIDFIKHFSSIYTLNYDLLLYWATMKLKELKPHYDNDPHFRLTDISDGFADIDGDVVYLNDSAVKHKIHYLHGALHIFDHKYKIVKSTYLRTGKTLRQQTLENLEESNYPIFISEGTSDQKKAKIIHNAYLNHSYKSLNKISSGNLIVFGTMLKTNDNHIREAIINNRIKNIYIGISSVDKIKEFDSFVGKLNVARKVHFYDYKTVRVWR